MPDRNSQGVRPRLLLIAAPNSYRTVAYLEAARRHGVDVLVASEGKYSLVGEIAAGLHIDLSDPDSLALLLQASREHPFDGVVATDDTTVELASRIGQALDLPHNPPQAAKLSHYKHLSRQALADAHTDTGVRVPAFRIINLSEEIAPQLDGFVMPCVVKPLALSGSRGVIRADTPQQVQVACKRIQSILAAESVADSWLKAHVLVEEFIAGPEVAVEGLLYQGKLDVLAIFDKPDPLEGPFFEETYYITPSRHEQDVQQQVKQCVRSACAGLGLREGPIHAEVRLADSGCVIIEVASRTIGGECARLLGFGTGHNLEDLVICHAVGRSLPVEPRAGAAGVLMIPIPQAGILRRIEGITAARAVPFIEDILISIRDGYELVPLPEGNSYLGFMFACAPSSAEVEAALREAHAELEIVIAPLMRLKDQRV
ncbi:MAG: ATP-grasp domain-containing protein [Gammaproteobacteria bacterium]|nr:ATP-grasp domain-containing protein [Gammaproteobacteria bacterium]